MSKLFQSVKLTKPKKSLFDLSHEKKLSFNMGELIPCLVQEVVPGDKFKVNSELFLRFAPLVSPMMHRVNAYMHYFYVPNRLVWDNWQDFITGGRLGTDASVMPKMTYSAGTHGTYQDVGTLWDYMGLPPFGNVSIHEEFSVNALPFRAYQLIYNEYYRDQNLTAPLAITKGDTVDANEKDILRTLRNRCWEKDYFTSALPWTQKGGESLLPYTIDYADTSDLYKANGTNPGNGDIGHSDSYPHKIVDSSGSATLRVENIEDIEISINDLRRSARLQAWLEKNALGGSRYIESILAHFGVRSSDRTLQRPQYLGGGKTPVTISEVLNTSSTATEPQGNMAGHAIGVGNANFFNKYFEEHGFVIGILSVLPRTAYQQGIPRVFKKFDKFDFYWPEFANLGEQEVLQEELYWDYAVDKAVNEAEFGYQSRYAEYKFQNSTIHGDFRSSFSQWHMGRILGTTPALNEAFVTADPTHRIFAVTTTTVDKMYCQVYHNVKAIRPMPKYGTPGIHIM